MDKIIKSVLENDYTQKNFVVEISGFVDVYEDSYNEGQLTFMNEWELDTKTFSISDILEDKELIKKEVIDFINKELFNDVKEDDYIHLFSNFIDNRLFWSQMCDAENNEPTKTQYRLWKDEKIKLYTQNFDISITINNIEVVENDMYTIFGK